MKTTVLVFVDRENTSMGMRIASQEEFTQILIKNKELPLQERRLFTKDVIADTDGLDVMYIETGLPDYQKWNSKQTYRNKIQNAKRKYKFLSTDTLCANEDAGDLTDFIADSFCVEKAVVEKETMRQLRAALENWKPWANEVLRFYLNGRKHILYEPFKSAEDAAAFIRTILKEHHVHIKTAAADDIALCREKYNLMKRRKLR